MANVYQLSASRSPCYLCLVSRDNLNNINLTNISSRTPNYMKKVIEDSKKHYYSIHPEPNAFWEIRYKLKLIRFISKSKIINALLLLLLLLLFISKCFFFLATLIYTRLSSLIECIP